MYWHTELACVLQCVHVLTYRISLCFTMCMHMNIQIYLAFCVSTYIFNYIVEHHHNLQKYGRLRKDHFFWSFQKFLVVWRNNQKKVVVSGSRYIYIYIHHVPWSVEIGASGIWNCGKKHTRAHKRTASALIGKRAMTSGGW